MWSMAADCSRRWRYPVEDSGAEGVTASPFQTGGTVATSKAHGRARSLAAEMGNAWSPIRSDWSRRIPSLGRRHSLNGRGQYRIVCLMQRGNNNGNPIGLVIIIIFNSNLFLNLTLQVQNCIINLCPECIPSTSFYYDDRLNEEDIITAARQYKLL